jgi:NAD-dependent dihydropyrimidine dehydrogenase PreA subunit
VSTEAGPRHGIFITVEVDESVRGDAELARRLEEACPVDIFAAGEDGVSIVGENLDECVLCGLCLDASPPGAVRVVKLYDGGATLERV